MTDAANRRFAFITGAASGIGRATAELLAGRGWWVGGADRDIAGLESLCEELGRDRCRVWQLDVADPADWERVSGEVASDTGGRLDLLFNNAGIGVAGFFEEIPLEQSRRIVDVNLLGVIQGIYAMLPLLKATPGSLCFSTSSSAATFAAPNLAVYSATKFAVKGLTEALSVELARCDVRVADVLPGVIDTAIFGSSPVYVGGRELSAAEKPSGAPAASQGAFRLIAPEQVAEAVLASYEGDPRLHWYVPEEVEEIDREKASGVESMRDARVAARARGAGLLETD